MGDDAVKEMRLYMQSFPQEAEKINNILLQMERTRDNTSIFDRARLPGHITASGIILDQGKILLIHHPFLDIWIPPGGHVEAGEGPRSAVVREVLEETGIQARLHEWHMTCPHPIDIDLHVIPENHTKRESEHWHCDFRYVLHPVDQSAGQPELDCKWVHPGEIDSGWGAKVKSMLQL